MCRRCLGGNLGVWGGRGGGEEAESPAHVSGGDLCFGGRVDSDSPSDAASGSRPRRATTGASFPPAPTSRSSSGRGGGPGGGLRWGRRWKARQGAPEKAEKVEGGGRVSVGELGGKCARDPLYNRKTAKQYSCFCKKSPNAKGWGAMERGKGRNHAVHESRRKREHERRARHAEVRSMLPQSAVISHESSKQEVHCPPSPEKRASPEARSWNSRLSGAGYPCRPCSANL